MLTGSDDNSSEDVQVEQILEELLGKDIIIQGLTDSLYAKGALDYEEEEDEEKMYTNNAQI